MMVFRFWILLCLAFTVTSGFYDGDHTTAFGDNLFAVPLGALWS